MLNPDFFPTPAEVIKLMLAPWLGKEREVNGRFRGYTESELLSKTILEPSAGSGAILDWMSEHLSQTHNGHWGSYSKKMYACEWDADLKATLQGKSYKVIADDFLTYSGDYQFDLIVMNPPFSSGDRHVIKAFDTVAPGGDVVALLNSETIRNPFSETRQLLAKLITDHGSAEELGRVFQQAERTTNVEVTLVRLHRPATNDPLNFEFKGRTREQGPDLSEDTFKDAVATRDVIGNMIAGYDLAKQAFVDYMKAREALRFYGADLKAGALDIVEVAEQAIKEGGANRRSTYNHFADTMKQHIWGEVLRKINLQKYMTSSVQKNFEQFGKQQGYMDFTQENVAALISMLLENSTTILEKAVTDVFDVFTEYHKENRTYVEGWKTNSKFKVNRKIILPNWVRWGEYVSAQDRADHGAYFELGRYRYSEYGDIDRVMSYLTGTNYDTNCGIREALESKFKVLGRVAGSFDGTCESTFFNLRFFKKGTLHIEFKDPTLWQEFNLRACAGKLWLPEPEMKAYQARTHSPFQKPPQPKAPLEAMPDSKLLSISAGAVEQSVFGDQLSLFAA